MNTRLHTVVATVTLMVGVLASPAMATHTNGPMMVGDAITEAFALESEEVHDLHESGIGFGAIIKLEVYAIALGVDVETLLATMEVDPETGEFEFAFGELKKTLTDVQLALLETLPGNLGQIVSGANGADQAGEGKPEWAGEGKPAHAGQGKPPFGGDDEDEDDEGDDGEGDDGEGDDGEGDDGDA
jgi:hypothetical protein